MSGTVPFLPMPESAVLKVAIGDRVLGSFPVDKLAASEVRFFSVEAALPTRGDAVRPRRHLDFAARRRASGGSSSTLDCQTSDNRSVRRGQSLQASLDRVAG